MSYIILRFFIIARVNREAENPKEVVIDPPNIKTNPVKKGAAIDKVLFHHQVVES